MYERAVRQEANEPSAAMKWGYKWKYKNVDTKKISCICIDLRLDLCITLWDRVEMVSRRPYHHHVDPGDIWGFHHRLPAGAPASALPSAADGEDIIASVITPLITSNILIITLTSYNNNTFVQLRQQPQRRAMIAYQRPSVITDKHRINYRSDI